jgi:large repetitive protein
MKPSSLEATPNLRVFLACLLSFGILVMPFAQLAAATKQRSEIRIQRSEKTRGSSPTRGPQTGIPAGVGAVSESASEASLNPPIPEPAPMPIGGVTATMAGAITTDADADGKADPGVDTITYTATITNNTGGDVSGLQFTDTIDSHTSFVAGSAVAAVDDTYSTTTNTQIDPVAAQGVLANDFNPDNGNNTGMTVSSYGKSTGLEQTSVGSSTATALSGTVTVNADGSFTYNPPAGVANITDTFKYAANSGGKTAIATVRIAISCPTITVTNPGITTGTAGVAFSQTFMQSGGNGTITWSETGALPSGISINTSTGVLSGTTSQTGSFPITVTATDQNGCQGTGATYTLTINCQTITITNPGVNSVQAGAAFDQAFTATGILGTATWSETGSLPSGITINNSTGHLAGTTNAVGSYPITVKVTDTNGCFGTSSYTLTVTCPTITVTRNGGGSFPTATFNVAYPGGNSFTASGGSGSYTFAYNGGTPPPGINLASNGTLSGTPTATGTFTFTVTATDASTSCTGSQSFTIAVNPAVTNDSYSNLVNNTEAVVTGGNTTSPTTPFVSLSGTIVSNDAPAGNVTIGTTGTFSTTQGGSVTIASDGTFKYTPPVTANALSSDTFNYTASSNTGVGSTGPSSATGTVTLNLSNRVWYVKNNGSNGNGQSQSPFNSLANFTNAARIAPDAASDIIFVYNGDGTTTNQNSGIKLLASEQLIGEGVALVVNSNVLVAAGTKPQITNTTAASDAVTLNDGNTVKGLTITGATRDGISSVSAHAGFTADTLTVQSNTGVGVDLISMTGTVTITNSTISTVGNQALTINNGTAAVTANNTNTIGGGTGTAVSIINRPGSAGAITIGATINNGRIQLLSNLSGTISFTGSQTLSNAGANGVTATTNSGATINFSGTLNVTTTTGIPFQASGGGTLNVTGTANLTSGAATNGLSLNGMTVGSSGVTFSSVSTTGALTGINLVNFAAAGTVTVGRLGGANTTQTETGTISNNTIVTGSSACSTCSGITVNSYGTSGLATISVTGNNVSGNNVNAMNVVGASGGNSLNITIQGNTFSTTQTSANDGYALDMTSGGAGGDTDCLFANIGDMSVGHTVAANKNTINGNNWVNGPGGHTISLAMFQGSQFKLANYAGGSTGQGTLDAAVGAWVAASNTNGGTDAFRGATATNNFAGGAVCPLLLALGGISSARDMFPLIRSFDASEFSEVNVSTPTTPASTFSNALSQSQLDSIVTASIQRWSATGLTQQQIATLRRIKFEVTDLSGSYLGEADGNRIQVDRNAEGKGWFVDANPLSDSHFAHAASATRRYTDPMNAAAGHVDLLTAIEHEMGHKLGLDDSYAEKDRDSLMYGYLTVGERRTPAYGEAKNAKPEAIAGVHHLTLKEAEVRGQKSEVRLDNASNVRLETRNSKLGTIAVPVAACSPSGISGGSICVDIPTLHNGDSITITYQVTVNNLPNLSQTSPAQVSNFGTVSGTASATTNTVNTPVDRFQSTTTLGTSGSPSDSGTAVTFTATVAFDTAEASPTPNPSNTVPAGTAQFFDGVSPITCTENSSSTETLNGSGVATCTTSSLSAPSTHSITAQYSGDGNFNPNTSNTVSQLVVTCDNPSTVTKTVDDGSAGTLRYAIAHVCTNGTVNFSVPDDSTITLASEIAIAKNMSIVGPANRTTVSGGGTNRVFNVSSTTVSISNLTISGGKVTAANGAGLLNSGGTVTLTDMLFTGNTAVNGGGGALASLGGTLNVYNSTIDGNTATNGGGVYHDTAGTVTLLNDTITSNTANGDVGGGPLGGGGDSGGVRSLNGVTTNARNTIIALNSAGTNADSSGVTDSGNNIIGTDPQIGSLTNNGGPTRTRALLPASPAIEAGDNTSATSAGLTTDQRGTGFPRIADSADADTTATVDIGAFELHPSVEDITDKSTAEDTPLSFSFNIGDGTGALISSVTASSGNTALVPNDVGHISVTGSGSTRTLNIAPATNANSSLNGTATITVTVTATNGQTAQDTFVLTVTPVADTPSVTSSSTNEDTQTTTGLVISRNAADGAEVTHFKITNIQHGTLFQNNGTTQINAADFITFTQGNAGLRFTPAADFNNNFAGACSFDVQASTSNTNAGLGGSVVTATISVTAVNDVPSFTKGADQTATINAGAQTVNNWATSIAPGPATATDESGQVLNFIVTNNNNGLFSSQPAVSATGTLTYTPAANQSGSATVSVSLHDNGGVANGGVDTSAIQTFTITVNCGQSDVVTNTNDNGAGSLRNAIVTACAGDAITFSNTTAGGAVNFSDGSLHTITLTSGELGISQNLTITGPGANLLTLSGNNASRVINIQSGTATISNLKVSGGAVTGGNNGGGVLNAGTLNLINTAVSSSTTANQGGGIFNSGTLTIVNSTSSGNTALSGGGVYNNGSLTLINATLSGNSATGQGGGLFSGGNGAFTNVTITNNRSDSDNTGAEQGGGIFRSAGTLTLKNTIVAGNFRGSGATRDDVSGAVDPTSSFTLVGDGTNLTGVTNGTNNNQIGSGATPINAMLGVLAGNGGAAQTHLLLPGSPAINAGSNANLPPDAFDLDGDSNTAEPLPVDQRGVGFNRVINTTVDIGAVEVNYAISATAGTPQSATINTAFGTALQATVKESGNNQSGVPVTFTAPASGASGTFSGNVTTANAATNGSGVAIAPAFTANGTAGGPYNVVASLAGGSPAANFALTNIPANQTITVTLHAPLNATYNTGFTVAATASSGLAVTFSSSGACTNVGANFTMTSGTGTCTVKYDQAGNGNFNAAPQVTESVTAQKANQTITFGALANKTFGNPDFSVSATASSSLALSFTASGQCTVTGSTVHLTAAGSCTITAKQAGDGNFNAATDVPQSFTIAKAATNTAISSSLNPSNLSQSVTFTATVTGPAGAGTPTGTVQFKDGGNPITCANAGGQTLNGGGLATCQTSTLTAGSHTITADYSGDGNFVASTGTLSGGQVVSNVPLISFSAANYNVNENDGVVHVIVNRTGDTSTMVTVDYATDDTGASTDCDALNSGLASSRCDFTAMFGTLQFAANEAQKILDIPVNQDSYTEGPETFTINLSNPTGNAAFVTPSSASVTINDSAAPAPNAIDDTTTFVRQQYHDFLNREPDAAGLAFWKNNIDKCNDPAQRAPGQTLAQCIEVQRIITSAAFFLSIEFMQSGTFVRSFYVAALDRPATNNMPAFGEWLRDTQAVQRGVIVGQGNWQATLDANRSAFMNDFVMRAEFIGMYPTTDTPTIYINKLYNHALGRNPTAAELSDGLSAFGGATTAGDPAARGQALLKVTQAADFVSREMPRAFVQIEYFGYLRRNPNDPPDNNFNGYNFWLNKLNQFNGDFLQSEMVKAFLSSSEYRRRFGS